MPAQLRLVLLLLRWSERCWSSCQGSLGPCLYQEGKGEPLALLWEAGPDLMELPLKLPPTSPRLLVEVPAATVFAALSARGLPWWLLSKLAAGALRGGRLVDLMAISEADLERSGIVHPHHKQQVWMGLKSLLQDFGPSTGRAQLPRPRSGRKILSRPQQRPSTSRRAPGRPGPEAEGGTSGQSRLPGHRFGPWLPPGPFRPPPLEEVLESRRETFCSDAPSRKAASPREAVARSPKSAADSSPRGTACGSPSSWRRKQVTCKVDTGRAAEVKRKDFIPLEELAACQRAAALREDDSKETLAPADDGGLDWEHWLTYRLKPSGPLHVVEKLVEAALGTNSQLLHDAMAVVEEQGVEFKKCLESTPPPDEGMELLSDPGLRRKATSLWSWVHARSDQLDLYKADLQRQLEEVSKNIMVSQLVTLKNNRLSSHGIQQRAFIARRGPSAGTISWRNSLKSELSESLFSGAVGSLGVFSSVPSRERRRSVELFEAPPLLEGQGRAATGSSSSFSGVAVSATERLRQAARAVMLLLRCIRVFNFNRAENEQVTYERRRNLILRQQEQLAKDGAQLIAMLERGGVDDLREDVHRVLEQLKSVREELLERYALHGKQKVEQALAEAMKKGDNDSVDLDKLGNVLLEIMEEPGNHVLLGEKALRQAQQAGLACRVDLVDQGPYAWEGLSVPPPWEELFLKSLAAYRTLRRRQPSRAWRRLSTLVAVGVSSQPIQQGDETV